MLCSIELLASPEKYALQSLATRVKKIELTQVSLVNSFVDLFSLFFCCTEHITNFVIRKVTIFTFFMVTILFFSIEKDFMRLYNKLTVSPDAKERIL